MCDLRDFPFQARRKKLLRTLPNYRKYNHDIEILQVGTQQTCVCYAWNAYNLLSEAFYF